MSEMSGQDNYDNDDHDNNDNNDDRYIMMKCVFVMKNHHFPLPSEVSRRPSFAQ